MYTDKIPIGRAFPERIYVCHTYYHVLVSMIKEMNLPRDEQGGATMVLSLMSLWTSTKILQCTENNNERCERV